MNTIATTLDEHFAILAVSCELIFIILVLDRVERRAFISCSVWVVCLVHR